MVPVLTAMPAAGIPPGDILDDSGCSHRDVLRLSPAGRFAPSIGFPNFQYEGLPPGKNIAN